MYDSNIFCHFVLSENFELKKGELTRKGFMDLNQMEANDVEGDTDDLWVTLHSMGFNNRLELDQVSAFVHNFCQEIFPYSPF